MGDKRPWPQVLRRLPGVKRTRGEDETETVTSQHRAEKITVAVDADLLQCCVCSGPLTTPLFQCTKGHISCSECCTDAAMADECECLMCREPETATRCRAMERVLAGVSVPCPFRQHGCAEMIPYASKEAHEGACRYAPCHCPIPGCAGYAGKSLVDHVQVDHPDVHRTRVKPGCLTALRMRSSEQARMVWLDNCAELLLVAGRDMPGGRSLSIVGLVDDLFEFEDELKYRIEVVGKDGVLSLSGPTKGVKRLDRPYQASAFLFVPNAIWDSNPEDIPVFIHLK
ncbi:E3 ubiquitin-protein ligase SINA-like 7 [Panicum miliaceum]|uniref:E3 ubiquitin-protein ligase SINA-like 7 n=1 Tax=Panicum miliaceum TaxID=4540 RepID=A0A3L6SLV4_PANMI|nr:E3 ubiquitin-protein ligase SINA-like 7 [Panicum miliaceum]